METDSPSSVGREVIFTVSDHIAHVRLNRPAVKNAVDGAVTEALTWIVAEVERNPLIRVTILASSTPGMFCSGADLGAIARGEAMGLVNANGFAGLSHAIRKKPWIAAIDGPAVGGGFELAIACDMIVASENTFFALPEVKRGLIAGGGGITRLTTVLPRNLAYQMLTTGEPVSAERGLALGLVNSLVAGIEVDDAALKLANAIAANAPLAVQASLHVARTAAEVSENAALDAAAAALTEIASSEDAKEGPRAFTEKRLPRWQGR